MLAKIRSQVYFNSRPREEVDRLRYLEGRTLEISTHDLARRSTKLRQRKPHSVNYFNSRPREEVDGAAPLNSIQK